MALPPRSPVMRPVPLLLGLIGFDVEERKYLRASSARSASSSEQPDSCQRQLRSRCRLTAVRCPPARSSSSRRGINHKSCSRPWSCLRGGLRVKDAIGRGRIHEPRWEGRPATHVNEGTNGLLRTRVRFPAGPPEQAVTPVMRYAGQPWPKLRGMGRHPKQPRQAPLGVGELLPSGRWWSRFGGPGRQVTQSLGTWSEAGFSYPHVLFLLT